MKTRNLISRTRTGTARTRYLYLILLVVGVMLVGTVSADGECVINYPTTQVTSFSAPMLGYDALVYLNGTEIWAINSSGYKIASGNSPADDTAVIQAAIDHFHRPVAAGPRGTIYLASGVYNVSSTINMYNGIGLVSMQAGWWSSNAHIGAVLYSPNLDSPVIKVVGDSTYPDYTWFPYIQNIHIRGDGNIAHTNNHGISADPEGGSVIMDIYLINVMVNHCGADGFHINTGGKVYIDRGYAEDNFANGIYFRGSGGGFIRGLYIFDNVESGILIMDTGVSAVDISENDFRVGNNANGIKTYSSGKIATITNNRFLGIGSATTGILIQTNNHEKKVVVMANVFSNLTTGIKTEKGNYWVSDIPNVTAFGNIFSGTTTPFYSTDFTIEPPSFKIGMNIGNETENYYALA